MGIWHFLPLGESPGAVTAALAYVKKRHQQADVGFFGGDSNRLNLKKTSGIIIFTTPEVRNAALEARNRKYIDNAYGQAAGREHSLGNEQGKLVTLDVVKAFIDDEYGAMLREEQGAVYWLEASYNDLDFNFQQIARAFYVLSPPDKTGREVWVNMTGGSNVMNLATLLITVMSGITGRAYYTYTTNISLLRPADEGSFWCDIPVLKLNYDRDYETILQVLEENNDWMDSTELYSRVLQSQGAFPSDREMFARNYLNKLDGWLIERQGNRNRLLQPAAGRFLDLVKNELIRALIYKEPLQAPPRWKDVFHRM